MQDLLRPQLNEKRVNAMSALALAHIGDGVFELMVRTRLCLKGDSTNHRLHKDTVAIVRATSQARYSMKLQPLLTEEEQGYYRRGRNSHSHAAPKNVSPVDYAKATGFETLFGALYLLGRQERLQELFAALWEDDHAL